MTEARQPFTLHSYNSQAHLSLCDIQYQGDGTYDCLLETQSNGFMCRRHFRFDNDEYFLAKLRALLDGQSTEAELMDLTADSFIRLRPADNGQFWLTGYIVEHSQVTHSIEFAFLLHGEELQEFARQFSELVRNAI